ncbi:hypothetical protein JM93_04331 [Roseibium hamelinense]|uniref:Uncharacterized protein n=1 Tax=Roseibium hamelinense TaxID=150831 RepID=A0A562SG70_9HYPH|nr:hypothetical protein [Roseibium hamelinense]MTI42561.1 hypothetical protein [Roseibium hamelinense]TWI79560.1 hypothetical protein JM93_04331 [Roseibium hamelinense]
MASTPTLDQLADQIDDWEAYSSTDALVDADSGTHYQTTYTYFYVPTAANDSTLTSDDSGLGTFLRLGEYSDIEQSAFSNSAQASYYPAQHIADESGDSVYKNAAGGGKGILMACDGRMLVRVGEKLYINSDDAIHIESTNSTVTITSGDSQDITICAGDSSDNSKRGDITTTSKKYTKDVDGEEYTRVTSVSRKYYEANKYDIYKAEQYKEVYEKTTTMQHATSHKFFYGGAMSIKLSGEFVFTLSVILNIEPISKITLYGAKFDIGVWKLDVCSWKTETKGGHFTTNGTSNWVSAVKTDTNATEANTSAVEVQTSATTAETSAVETESKSVKSLIAFWEAKIASTAQI